MKRLISINLIALITLAFCVGGSAFAADIELAKKSTLEKILQRGELRVGFEAGYMPFEMTDKKGRFVGFDIDMGIEMAKALGVKPVFVDTFWPSIIPALKLGRFDASCCQHD